MIIERIETAGPDRRARRLVFGDFQESRTTSATVVRALGLEEGCGVDAASLEQSLTESELVHARERALRLLGYRERSVHELRNRLLDDGYPSGAANAVVERLREIDLVDDDRFARSWARTRAAAGLGPQRVLRELAAKGVDGALASVAAAEAYEERPPLDRARAILGDGHPRTRSERDRAIRKLLRRGFDMGTALKALEDADEGA